MDIQYLMRQAKKLEKAMADAKEKLGDLSVEGESGGGLVKVQMNGKCEITRLSLDPKVLEPFAAAATPISPKPSTAAQPLFMQIPSEAKPRLYVK